ncbi:DUF6602 domain-containing protein [Aeromonas caviae]|uniref:DUF6602 domain-containing protein n=1 Tax=Aeromonas caviae TaxID=648 RepID=UPI00111A43CF|nr:DUF6602 domain-containing protein [Aeromonas caviae]MBL0663564.1 hypothetical protein [Aeromonas caviae]
MAGQFFDRLRKYYLDVAAVLRGEAQAASIFPNTTDIGMSRERVYAEFLKHHAPSKCNVFYGGFLFGEDGTESPQLDVIVTTDTTPRFNLHNKDGNGKSFSPVEGTLAVASIKSTLNKNELEDALTGIARIPPTSSLDNRVSSQLSIKNYGDWPYKIIYASDGITAESLLIHLKNYYQQHPYIPVERRPNIIHVSGKYVIIRALPSMSLWDFATQEEIPLKVGQFTVIIRDPDLQGIIWVLDSLQAHATASTHILYSYGDIINRVNGLPS